MELHAVFLERCWECPDRPLLAYARPGADPGLVVGEGANPLGGGADPIYLYISEKPHEIKEILVRGGGSRERSPLNPPLPATPVLGTSY